MNILSWNCQAEGNEDFRRVLKELVKDYCPNIVIILEPKVPSMGSTHFFSKIRYDKMLIVEVNGRASGIWLAFNSNKVQIMELGRHEQVIHIRISGSFNEFTLSAVYGSPTPLKRERLWDNIRAFSSITNGPWILAGDFNDYRESSERKFKLINDSSRKESSTTT